MGVEMFGMSPKYLRIEQSQRGPVGAIGPSAAAQPQDQHAFAAIDMAMAQCASPCAARTRGRPKADRGAIARSLAAMSMFGIPTVAALIERLALDSEFRLQCGWRTPSEVPTPATFSRVRAEFARKLPESVHRLLPSNGRQIYPLCGGQPEVPEPADTGDAEPLLSMLNRQLRSMIRTEERDLTLPQLAIFLTCYHGDRQHTVRSLADELDLFQFDVARALIRLERWMLVRRRLDPHNRRRHVVLRTENGKRFLAELLLRSVRDDNSGP